MRHLCDINLTSKFSFTTQMNIKKIILILLVALPAFSCNTNNSVIDDTVDKEGIYGYATYTDGTPIAGMVVSDGFTTAITDKEGFYSIESPSSHTFYIFASVPADCKIVQNSDGNPDFYHKYTVDRRKYDFKFERIDVENDFVIYALADPQCKDNVHIARFETETIADIHKTRKSENLPIYGVTLGDIVYSEGKRNCGSYMAEMRRVMSQRNIGFPVFQTMGNHDVFSSATEPIVAQDFNLGYQRDFESVFGPVNFSWNRGSVHFVHMRNVIFQSNTVYDSYEDGFTMAQVEWLKQDLKHVPKDKMVVLCVHIPLLKNSDANIPLVRLALSDFQSAIVFSGHTHYMRNEPDLPLPEKVHAAVSGAWWHSVLNGDGSPNGYGIHYFSGNKIVNSIYKGVNGKMASKEYQIRMYRGNARTGGQYEKFQFPYTEKDVVASIFNSSSAWNVKVFEDDVYSGDMKRIPAKRYSGDVIGADSSQDWWAIGYNVGVVGRGYVSGTRSSYMTSSYATWKYTLKNPQAAVRIEATDGYGNKYICTKFTSDYDYSDLSM